MMSHDPIAQRVARRHMATAALRDPSVPWLEFGRLSAVDLQNLLEPHVGAVSTVRIALTQNAIVWTAVDTGGNVVSGQVAPKIFVVGDGDGEVIVGATVTLDPAASTGVRIEHVDLALG